MRTWRNLFTALHDETHLARCARAASRGKRRDPEVAWFLFRVDSEVRRIAAALRAEAWTPGGFDLILLRDPKPRAVARAPFADRVVHTALVTLLEPVFLPSTVEGDLACRQGGGTHRAVLLARRFLDRHRFAVHLDIRAYFPSVEPATALDLVARRVADERFLAVLERVLASGAGLVDRPGIRAWIGLPPDRPPPGIGLPLGAHTSQFLATHVYLLELDHLLKRRLRIPGYVRFVDDFLLFADSRDQLREARAFIREWLGEHRRLRLKHPGAPILSARGHLDALGVRMRRGSVDVLPRAVARFRARVRAAAWDDRGRAGPRVEDALVASVRHLIEP